ncbi:MAG: DUF2062 domain-containing protein [Arenicella sp.]
MRFFRKLRRKLPKKHEIENTPSLSMFKSFWKRPELWAMNRNSLPLGIAIGIFCAFMPMPFEMVLAAFLAIALGGNVIFAISFVWISNPFTWIPLYTPCYWIGTKIFRIEPIAITNMSSLRINAELGYHYAALWVGCTLVGLTLAFLSYFTLKVIWRRQVRHEWGLRKSQRLLRKKMKGKKARKIDEERLF